MMYSARDAQHCSTGILDQSGLATRQKYDVAGISKGIKLDYLNIHQGN